MLGITSSLQKERRSSHNKCPLENFSTMNWTLMFILLSLLFFLLTRHPPIFQTTDNRTGTILIFFDHFLYCTLTLKCKTKAKKLKSLHQKTAYYTKGSHCEPTRLWIGFFPKYRTAVRTWPVYIEKTLSAQFEG